jgi:DNA/RNA endonuclease YhcR with UshA esterase domain
VLDIIFLLTPLIIFNQTELLVESFTGNQFPPAGWDTLRSDTVMGNWFRYKYTGQYAPDSFHARVQVYNAQNWQRSGWSILKTVNLDLLSVPVPESLFFWYRFSAYSGNLGPDDTMYIDITNNDITWYNLLKIGESDEDTAWRVLRIDLSPYDTFTNARIRFRYEDRPNDSLAEWNRNFWLDSVKVISCFVDTIPPTVINTTPAQGDTGIDISSSVIIYFSEPIDPFTIIPDAFNVQGKLSGIHPGALSYDSINCSVLFNPDLDFSYAETVYVTVFDTIMDLSGNKLDGDNNGIPGGDYQFCFYTASSQLHLVINELLVDPESFDHNNNGNYGDADEEFIEVFNKEVYSVDLQDFQILDYVGANTLTIMPGFVIPAYGYLLLYASGEAYIISGDLDTLTSGNWHGTWPNLDQNGDTIILLDNSAREVDRKSYLNTDVIRDYSIARMPNGTHTWVNNALPTPGRSNGDIYVWPIAQAFRDLDSNYIPDLMDSVVTITGVVTAPPGIFSNDEAYIQDNTAGVNLYGSFPVTLDYGDSVIATGTVYQYNGKNELTQFTCSLIQHSATLPDPIEIDGVTMGTEQYEGSLVKIKVSYIDAFIFNGDTKYRAWDILNTFFDVWIDKETNIPGSIAPLDTFTLIAIKSQYDRDSIPDEGYELLPRDTSDFSHLTIIPEVKSIKEIQEPGLDGVSSKYVDSLVVVEGVVTGPNYVFSSSNPSFYVQDQTGGINVYNTDGDDAYMTYIDSLGARIRVLGTVTEYNGLTEIANGYGWFKGMDTVPLPKELQSNKFVTEDMEGMLIKLRGVIKTIPYKTGDGYNFDILNGNVGIAIRFTTGSGINPATIKRNEERVFTSIVGQYDPEAPYTTGYQVLLRFPQDIATPDYDTASSVPLIKISGPKTFIPEIGELAEIKINSPIDHQLYLSVYDMNYRSVKELYSGAGGPQVIYWGGKNNNSRPCKLGIYLLNLKAVTPDGESIYKRILIVLGTRF